MVGKERKVLCKWNGLPNTITFFRVEQKSYFNEHIRYIEVSSDGIATLPSVDALDRYQHTGLYVCNASNDIPNREGNKFQQGKAYLVSDGKYEVNLITITGFVLMLSFIMRFRRMDFIKCCFHCALFYMTITLET